MEEIYKSKLHNYMNIKFTDKELSKIYYMLETDNDFVKNVNYSDKGDGVFFFHTNSQYTHEGLIDYFSYLFNHKAVPLLIRKKKIEKIMNKEGS